MLMYILQKVYNFKMINCVCELSKSRIDASINMAAKKFYRNKIYTAKLIKAS